MWAALRKLPLGQRKVVILRHYLGLSVEETAADLGISTGTVKSQTSDALSALRRALASEFGVTVTEGEVS
jgi:RNA polymerase sigma factor (sigma-70 family)